MTLSFPSLLAERAKTYVAHQMPKNKVTTFVLALFSGTSMLIFVLISIKRLCKSKEGHFGPVNRWNWKLAMIKTEGTQHAQVVVEGVSLTGNKFTQIVHLRGASSGNIRPSVPSPLEFGQVEIIDLTNNNQLRYDGHSEIWTRSRFRVARMMSEVYRDVADRT